MALHKIVDAVAVDHSDGADTVYSNEFYWDMFYDKHSACASNFVLIAIAADANVTANFDIEIYDGANWIEIGITSDGVTNTETATVGTLPPCGLFRLKVLTTAGGTASTVSAYMGTPA